MSVRRVMGVETEYGIFDPQHPGVDSEELSRAVLDAYVEAATAGGLPTPVRWDYSGELADTGAETAPSWVARLTEQEQRWYRGTSSVLTSGARLYVDHGHPEYCSPEVTSPRQVVRYDAAGDLIMLRAVERLAAQGRQILLYKNNVDGKGSAYGSHENYLVDRKVPFETLTEALVPFLVTRPVLCGSGRVGLGPRSEEPGFQLWQRADYVERETGLETTVNRPIVNTRDEPHADRGRWRRLHVITGDATSLQTSTLLKVGTLSLVLWVVERVGLPPEWAALRLADPVAAGRTVSRDPGLTATVPLADGRSLKALEVQRAYLDVVERHLRETGTDPADDPDTEQVRRLWDETLGRLRADPWSAGDTVEWVAKHTVLTALAQRAQVGWDDARLAAADLQWADLRPDRGIAASLARQGRVRRVVDAEEVATAEAEPPEDTRAWLRGEAIRVLGDRVFAASWQSLVVDTGERLLVRMPLPEPAGCSRTVTQDALAAAGAARDPGVLLERLTGHARPPGTA